MSSLSFSINIESLCDKFSLEELIALKNGINKKIDELEKKKNEIDEIRSKIKNNSYFLHHKKLDEVQGIQMFRLKYYLCYPTSNTFTSYFNLDNNFLDKCNSFLDTSAKRYKEFYFYFFTSGNVLPENDFVVITSIGDICNITYVNGSYKIEYKTYVNGSYEIEYKTYSKDEVERCINQDSAIMCIINSKNNKKRKL
jgi:hypothetical protein